MNNNSTLTHEVILPSRGALNPEIPDGKIVQRCMMVHDQKYLAGSSSSDGGVQKLIQETIVSPENIDVRKLCVPDTLYLLFCLRSLSYGKNFKFTTRCPACGKKMDVTVDLSALEVFDLDEDYQSNLKVELPVSGDTVYTKICTNGDFEDIAHEVERLQRTSQESEGLDYVLRLSKMIIRVELKKPDADGEKTLTDPVDIRKYVDHMTDYDATAVMSTVESISFGVSDTAEVTCYHCKRIVDIGLRFDPSFFRPRFDLPSKRNRR